MLVGWVTSSIVHTLLLILQCRYRFVELYYRRAESTHKGKLIPARVETVVLFLPDVWSCLPTRLEWDNLQVVYKKQLDRIVNVKDNQNVTIVGDDESAASSSTIGASDEKASILIFNFFPVIVFTQQSQTERERESLGVVIFFLKPDERELLVSKGGST